MIHVLVGISGSGKSTQAARMREEFWNKNQQCVIINRDKLREQLFGYTEDNINRYYLEDDFRDMEEIVSQYVDSQIELALRNNLIVIADATHLQGRYLNHYHKFGVDVTYTLVDAPLHECISRDSKRNRKVGSDIIKKQHASLEKLKKNYKFDKFTVADCVKLPYNTAKKNAYVFDIDGTLALNNSGRNPFDGTRVLEDDPNDAVVRTLCHMMDGNNEHFDVIICSGRGDDCRADTKFWLDSHLTYDYLLMRKAGDNRPDWIIKGELWNEIQKTHNIIAMFDDRNQVVNYARKCGFDVFQVNYGDF